MKDTFSIQLLKGQYEMQIIFLLLRLMILVLLDKSFSLNICKDGNFYADIFASLIFV